MKLQAFDILGLVLGPVVLGGITFYVVAPQASGLGLVGADPFSFLICLPIAIFYGITYGTLQKRKRASRGVVSALLFLFGAMALVFLYPAPYRFQHPGADLKTAIEDYVKRCVQGYDGSDKVDILPREKLLFDPFVAHQWKVTIWPYAEVKTLTFYIYEWELNQECRSQLILREIG